MNGTVYCETSFELWSEIGRITSNREKLLEFADTDEIGNYPLPTFTPDKSVDDIAFSSLSKLRVHIKTTLSTISVVHLNTEVLPFLRFLAFL